MELRGRQRGCFGGRGRAGTVAGADHGGNRRPPASGLGPASALVLHVEHVGAALDRQTEEQLQAIGRERRAPFPRVRRDDSGSEEDRLEPGWLLAEIRSLQLGELRLIFLGEPQSTRAANQQTDHYDRQRPTWKHDHPPCPPSQAHHNATARPGVAGIQGVGCSSALKAVFSRPT